MQRALRPVQLEPQQGWPMEPQVPPPHDPCTHVVVPQLLPFAWQVPPVQHPPLSHLLPSQQGLPGVPQDWHVLMKVAGSSAQTVLVVVQVGGAIARGAMQHSSPKAPQVVQPLRPHMPAPAPQSVPIETHSRSAPQHPVVQRLFAQHGSPMPPQSTQLPLLHILVKPAQRSPLEAQTLFTQHPPARQVLPAQQA